MEYNVINIYRKINLVLILLSIVFVLPASAGINLFYTTDGTNRNYTINDTVLSSNNFVRLIDGDIEMPNINLAFSINKTLVSGSRNIVINTSTFGPKTTSYPNQKVYIVSGSTAPVSYWVDASISFANTTVNVTTYRMVSNNVPFFSDFSIALLNFNDLKNTWSNDTKVLDMLLDTGNDENKIGKEVTVTLNSAGHTDTLTQSLAPGNYLILVTKGTDPKEIITSNIVKVMPFSSTTVVGDDSGFAVVGDDLNVNITLLTISSSENYTYITSIINRSDYADNMGNINIRWNSGTLANATKVNGKVLYSANSITDIIPRSDTTRTTTSQKSANLVLKTGALTAGSYLVNTLVFNSTNPSVAFNQRLITLGTVNTTNVTANINGTGYINATLNITTPDADITVTIPNGTTATLSNGVTPISNITSYSPTNFNSTLEAAASGSNLKFLGKNLTLLPAGAIFDPYILVRFNYSDADIPPSGVSEDSLKAYWYNSKGVWESLTTHELNKTGNYLIARVPHFSMFALLGTVTTAGPVVSGGSGDSSGGGIGVVTSEPYDNIARSETHEMNLVYNKPVLYTFKLSEHGIYEIAVTGKENENNIALRVELLKGPTKMAAISAPPGTVYKNVNIWAGSKRIKEGLIRFKVENTWIVNNKIASGELMMIRWNGNEWAKLAILELKKDDTHTFYEAKTEGFSNFAISALKGGVVPAATSAPGETKIAGTPVKSSEGTETATPVPTKKTPGFEAIVAVLAIAAFLFVIRNKGK